MAVQMIGLAGFIADVWPMENEDDYAEASHKQIEKAQTLSELADEADATTAKLSDMTEGEAAEASKASLEQTSSSLREDVQNLLASAGNLAARAQSIFNLKNIINSIAWGFWDFVSKIFAFFFGDPVSAEIAKETAENEAKLAAYTAKAGDDINADTVKDNIESGTDIEDNPPAASAPTVDKLEPGNNASAEMEGQELYDKDGNLLGTLNKDGTLSPDESGQAGGGAPAGGGGAPAGGGGQPQAQAPQPQAPQPQAPQPPQPTHMDGPMPEMDMGLDKAQQDGNPQQPGGQSPMSGGQPLNQPQQGQPQPGQPGQPQQGQPMPPQGQPQQGQPMPPQGQPQPQPQQQQQPYYGPVYDQNGKVLNQLPPQQVFGNQQSPEGYTPQGWGPMENIPQQYQNTAASQPNMMDPNNYGYNGTPQGLTDSLAQAGQEMVEKDMPHAPKNALSEFQHSLSQLSDSAAKLVGIAHELFGIEPADMEEDGEADNKGGGVGSAHSNQSSGDDSEGARAQEGGDKDDDKHEEKDSAKDEPKVKASAEVTDADGEKKEVHVETGGDEPDKVEEKSEPAPGPESRPEPRPLFKASLGLESPLFNFKAGMEIGTHLTSGAAVPALAGATAFSPMAAAPVSGGAFGGGMPMAGMAAPMAAAAGGAAAGAVAGASAAQRGATTHTTSGAASTAGQGRVGVGSTAFDPEAYAKSVNGGHGSAEVAPVVLRNNERVGKVLETTGDEVVPVESQDQVDDSVLSMLPPLVARGARVLSRIGSEMTARSMAGPTAAAVYSDGSVVFNTADGLGAVVSARPLAATPLMDELASRAGAGQHSAGDFITDWVGMDDPVAVLALAVEVGIIDRPEVIVTSQQATDSRPLPAGAQALDPHVLARVPAAAVTGEMSASEALTQADVEDIVFPLAAAWQFPETGLKTQDLCTQLVSRRWDSQDNGTAMVATVWWLIARTLDAVDSGDYTTATRLTLMLAGIPQPKNARA